MFRYFILVASLLLIANTITIQNCPSCIAHMTSLESPYFQLTLQYGSPDKTQKTSSAKIFWNGEEVSTLKPSDDKIKTLSIKVKAVEGANKLSITGLSGSTGVIVDNIAVIREGTPDNIVQNGCFDVKNTSPETGSNTFVGWTGQPSAIATGQLNAHWPTSNAALIGSGPKQSLSQTFIFDRQYRLQTPKYYLSFLYAPQIGSSLASTQGKVTWNKKVFLIEPTNHKVQEFKTEIVVEKNSINTLEFSGEGQADGFGLTITNVRLVALGSAVNTVVNGNFQLPALKSSTQTLALLPGWENSRADVTIGRGTFYNQHWSKKGQQVLTLDNKVNAVISQKFNIGPQFNYMSKQHPFFTITFKYAVPQDTKFENARGELLYGDEVIAEFAPQNKDVHHFHQKISINAGTNVFTIRPKTGSTILVGDFSMIRDGQKESIASNGDFALPAKANLIPGWSGSGQIVDSQQANSNWKGSKAIQLSSEQQNSITQTIELNNDLKLVTNKYILQLQYAPTSNAQLNVPLAYVHWNGQDYPLVANNKKVHTFKTIVIASRGFNQLVLSGQGKDRQGLTVDNVKLTPFSSSVGALANGDFEDPEVKSNSGVKKFYQITEWQGQNIELGLGENYNQNWPSKTGQVLSLVTPYRTVISKVLSLSENYNIVAKQPNQFTLSFKYAAQEGKPLDKSGGEIFWNKVLIGDITPTNYDITSYSLTFQAKAGVNNLFIKGAGGIEAYGLTLDDVNLVRQGSNDNLIENGNFEATPSTGWNSIIDHAPLLNHHWSKTHVGRIDAVSNLTLGQNFEFDHNFRYRTNKFVLKFQYTNKNGVQPSKAVGTWSWNKLTFPITVQSNTVHKFSKIVTAEAGQNVLKFEGEGLSLDNIRLIPIGSTVSVLFNGDFQVPQFVSDTCSHIPSGWNADQIEYAKFYHVSHNWPVANGQVVALNRRRHYLAQVLTLSSQKEVIRPEVSFYTLSLEYAASDSEQIGESKGLVYWSDQLVGTLAPKTKGVNKFSVTVNVANGDNTLKLKGKGSGIVVSNIKLVRYGSNENIVQNGNFQAGKFPGAIPNWQGRAKIDSSEKHSTQWSGAKVAVLTSKNTIIQKFIYDGNLRFITKKFVLSFQYAVRQGVKFETTKAQIIWNEKVTDIAPTDYDLHLYKDTVQSRIGNNYLIFESNGVKRHFGIFAEGFTVDNVVVRPFGSSKNLLRNGGFEENKVEGFDYGMFTNKVPGWITKDIYIGVGYYFSSNWGETQIMELDANKQNAKIMQGIKIGKHWEVIQ